MEKVATNSAWHCSSSEDLLSGTDLTDLLLAGEREREREKTGAGEKRKWGAKRERERLSLAPVFLGSSL